MRFVVYPTVRVAGSSFNQMLRHVRMRRDSVWYFVISLSVLSRS